MLIILGGLPGVGKTTIARDLARTIGGLYLRIDSIEQSLRNAGRSVEAEGYCVAYAIAEDNLRLGRTVVADCVNPIALTRSAWRDVARRANVPAFEVEVVCSDRAEHRRRVEMRTADLPGHRLPSWSEIIEREYAPWHEAGLLLDTAGCDVHDSVRAILARLNGQ